MCDFTKPVNLDFLETTSDEKAAIDLNSTVALTLSSRVGYPVDPCDVIVYVGYGSIICNDDYKNIHTNVHKDVHTKIIRGILEC